ncbi:GNAT family N-acetyltransferase [Petropleomorpha daqingensis]|uniref:Ribosomal protein S18 acetylase RimI-like enzyme n=1 Tax=Petropleomorpha daqingensis TaxID=2026353 RepID=A0A853CBF9_9ACTN|nr:GNAT family N-acetyltransferase [Petropleomorpha daqingensis]NYJ04471.1 ribosomal protein S18 acetylase RimI-like enzyme [Petropleomorpha daqingensis]
MSVVPLGPEHCDALLRFFRDLPDGDRTFIKEEVTDPATVRAWTTGGNRWVAVDGDTVQGYVAVLRLPGWSDHVGEVRLVVAPAARGNGLGRVLARHALVAGVEAGLTKLVVEVVAEQGAALALFSAIGFSGEALLRDHIRDREGRLRDLMVLAHHVGETWSGMDTVGVADELGEPG